MNWHSKNSFVLFKLQDHFVKEPQDSELFHVLNVKVYLLKVLLIQYELVLVETENMLRGKYNFGKWSFETNKSVTGDLNVLTVDSKEQAGFIGVELWNLKQVYLPMRGRIVYATPLLFSLLLKSMFGYIFYERRSNAYQKVLLDDLACSHWFAEHQELALVLVLYVLGKEDHSKIADTPLYFRFALFEIEQLVNVLHVGDWFLRVPDYNYLVVLCW